MNKKRVLIVDDEPSVRHVLHKMLSNNYIVLEAADVTVVPRFYDAKNEWLYQLP